MRKKVRLDTDFKELLILMSEGNSDAMSVIFELTKHHDGIATVLHLDDMNIRGWQIWVGYKDFCGADLLKFKKLAQNRDKEMIKYINDHAEKRKAFGVPYHIAVEGGASEG